MSPGAPLISPVVHAGHDELEVDVVPDAEQGCEQGQSLVSIQATPSSLGPTQPGIEDK